MSGKTRLGLVLAGLVTMGSLGWIVVAGSHTERTVDASHGNRSSDITSVGAASTTSSTSAGRELSPAWIEAQMHLEAVANRTLDAAGIAQARLDAEYRLNNPNEWTTPMGALCWANHELYRTWSMLDSRTMLDDGMVPVLMTEFGIGESTVGSNPSPARSKAVIDILSTSVTASSTSSSSTSSSSSTASSTSSVTSTTLGTTGGSTITIDAEFVAFLRLLDYEGGEGTEWLDALDAVAGEGWAAAVRAGEGLPVAVLHYADELAANAREQLLTDKPKLTTRAFGSFVDGYEAFIEMAKYDQNCLRSLIGDLIPKPANVPPDRTLPSTTTSTTVRSGTVTVSGDALSGVLTPAAAGIGAGYVRSGGMGSVTDTTFAHVRLQPSGYVRSDSIGSLTDTTFTYDSVGYEIERLLWWPNGTIRVDVYPGGLDTRLADYVVLAITSVADSTKVFLGVVGKAEHLGEGFEFVWDSTLELETGQEYNVELRTGAPGVPASDT